MEILFDEKQHRYTVDGEIASISVTQLLRKHGLAPNYANVSEQVLAKKAERGTDIHKDLECLIKYPKYDPFTNEGKAFKRYIDEFIDCAAAEQLLGYKYNNMWICGTADVVGFFKKKEKGCFIADHKTTVLINREYVSWQVSILDYMLRQADEINGKKINWKGANEFLCFHYSKDGELEVIKLDKIPDEEIERLFACEYFGEKYERKLLVLDNEIELGMNQISAAIEHHEKTLKKLEEQQKKYQEIIIKAMEEQGIKSFENDQIKLTYVPGQDRLVIDKEKVKRDYPQIYDKVLKVSKVKPSLRITLKGKE